MERRRRFDSAAERAASLTRQLLAFSRKQMLAPAVIDLNDIVADIEKMLNRMIGEDIDLVMVPGAEPLAGDAPMPGRSSRSS